MQQLEKNNDGCETEKREMNSSSVSHTIDHAKEDPGDHTHAADDMFLGVTGRHCDITSNSFGSTHGVIRIDKVDRVTVRAQRENDIISTGLINGCVVASWSRCIE